MSYNVAICTSPVPCDDAEVWEQLDELINFPGPPPPVFRELHDALTTRYPCMCSIPDERVDEDGVWIDGPLWNDFGHRAAVLGVVYSRVEEVLPFLVQTAVSLGLTVCDWGGPTVFRPNKK